MIRLFLFCFRSAVAVILMGVAVVIVFGGGQERVEREGVKESSGRVPAPRNSEEGGDWSRREAASKQKLVMSVPELGLPGHGLREEFDRRARLFRSVNPAFFDSPEWPERLWELMVRDLSLKERSVGYPWKPDGMGSARP